MPNHNEIYMNQAEMYEKMISKQPSLSEILKEIRDFRNLSVVDLGAGSGRLSSIIAPEAKSLTCTDSSKSMLELLETKLSTLNLNNWRSIVADHRTLPIETATIDLVVSGWSICYLTNTNHQDWESNIRKVMSEITRILRPDGTIIILETMGTGTEVPNPPDFLKEYYRILEEEHGFEHRWIRTDYHFTGIEEAEELIGFFFGTDMAKKVIQNNWIRVPECAGIWWRHM
jgi:ubiquinone/menaquinone biosynthesis C-methylase UbiE